jgi:DNA repair exonuclease SbcCD ATPase subunit
MQYAKYEDGQIITTITGARRLKAYCIACGEPVHYVKDHKRTHQTKSQKISVRAHFRHSNNIQASEEFLRQHHPESIAHRAAKQSLLAGKFHFSIRCGHCTKIIPIKFEGECREEVSYNKYRLDVAYMNKDTVVGGVEILHSSRVSDKKVRFLDKNIPWCEVKAEKVLKSTGHIFAERSHNQVCESCKRIEACWIAGRAKRAEMKRKRIEEARLRREREKKRQEQLKRIEEEERIRRIEEKREREKMEYISLKKQMEEENKRYERRCKEREQEEKKLREEREQEEKENREKEKLRKKEQKRKEANDKMKKAWEKYNKDMELYYKLLK